MLPENSETPSTPFDIDSFLREPSKTIRELDSSGELEKHFPAFSLCHGIRQSDIRHHEGDVFVHTLMTLDKTLEKTPSDEAYGPVTDERDLLMIQFALLYHDTGKRDRNLESQPGEKYDHAKKSAEHARNELASKLASEELEMVAEMIAKHEQILEPEHTTYKINKLAKLFALRGDIKRGRLLLKFAEGDIMGRGIKPGHPDVHDEHRRLIYRNIELYNILLEQLDQGLSFPLQHIGRPMVDRIKAILGIREQK